MAEQPNLNYIKKLSGDDSEFETNFITILQKEFPEEVNAYLNYLKNNELKSAAEIVHKLKHKFNILSMENAYRLAVIYEEELKVGRSEMHAEYQQILKTIANFLKTI